MAVALSYMGLPTEMVTKLPDNEIGRCAKRALDKWSVGTSHIAWGGERLGLYYLERGVKICEKSVKMHVLLRNGMGSG